MKTNRRGRASAAAKFKRILWHRLQANPSHESSRGPAPVRLRFWLRLGIAGLLCAGALYLGTVSLNVLILGTDDVDFSQHTDTIMLIHWRPLPRRLALLSVPRDTLVELPKRGPVKINAVYAYGNALNGRPYALAMTRASVENLTGLKIHYILNLHYTDFGKWVDHLGGIPFEVRRRIQYTDPVNGMNIALESGQQLFNGLQALNYLRFRHDDEGELGCIRRQQEFAKVFFSHITRFSRLPATIRAWYPFYGQVETNLSWTHALFLALEMRSVLGLPWQQAVLPGRAVYLEGVSYWQTHPETVRQTVAGLDRPVPIRSLPEGSSVNPAMTPEPEAQVPAEEPEATEAKEDIRPAPPARETVPAAGPASKTLKTKNAPGPKAPAPGAALILPKGRQPRVRILNGCGVQGVCRLAAERLSRRKIRTLPQDVTNAPNFKVSRSIVKTSRENLEWARYVAGSLGLDRSIQVVPESASYPTVTVVVGKDYPEWLK